MTKSRWEIRDATSDDIPQIFAMLRELASFEKLEHQLVATEDDMNHALFVEQGGPQALVAEMLGDGQGQRPLIAYAIFFENFSTFLCRRGIYLEDIYVRPEFRSLGIGKSLLRRLAEIAVERNRGRMEWAVLDWNQTAIDVYEAIGGEVLPDWRIVRLGTDAVNRLANS